MTTEWQQYGTIIYVGEGRMPQDVVGRIGNPDSCARAVACVNACAGIETHDLEEIMRKHGTIAKYINTMGVCAGDTELVTRGE